VYGAESDGKVTAWRRSDGEKLWTQEQLSFRGLSAPLAMARAVVVGDASGMVHILSGDDGSQLARLSTDGSAITSAPVLAGNTLVILTQAGNVFGFVPN
jgi:outer membrane protein assembly factor BamB